MSGIIGKSSKMFHTVSSLKRDVHIIPMFTDNYGYLLVDKESNTGAIVDPGDSFVFPEVISKLKVDLKLVLATHKHADHIGGALSIYIMIY